MSLFLLPLKGISEEEEKVYSCPLSDRTSKELGVHVAERSEHAACVWYLFSFLPRDII